MNGPDPVRAGDPARPRAPSTPPLLAFIFGGYVGFQFMMTHWPALTLPFPGRPDLVAHFTVFGTWNALLIACGRFGPRFSLRNIAVCTMIAAMYAGVDEGLQLIPAVRRHAAWDDYGCNVAGIQLVALGALILGRFFAPRARE